MAEGKLPRILLFFLSFIIRGRFGQLGALAYFCAFYDYRQL